MHDRINFKLSLAILASTAGLLATAAGPADAHVTSVKACTVTCLDQDLNSLKFDSNEMAVMNAAPRTSLGRENSIEI